VRVLAVAQVHHLGRAQRQVFRQLARRIFLLEARADGGVVIGRGAKRFLGEAPMRGRRQLAAARAQLARDRFIIVRRNHHGHIVVILRRRADHAGTADIDVLDQLRARHAGFARRVFKPIQIHHHHIDRQDAVFGDRAHVRRVAANGQDAARHMRVERLHTPVEHLGKSGHFRHVLHRHAAIANQPGRSPGGNDLRSNGMERRGEFQDAGLVGHAHQNALNSSHPCHDNRLAPRPRGPQ
jgi:hypothetical protein